MVISAGLKDCQYTNVSSEGCLANIFSHIRLSKQKRNFVLVPPVPQFSSSLAWRIPRGMLTGGQLLAYSSLQETVSGPGWAHSLRGPTFLERIDIPHMKERFLSQFQQTWTRRHVVPAADGSSIVTENGTDLRRKLQQRMAKQRGRQ